MDFSQLPKMSNTPQTPIATPPQAARETAPPTGPRQPSPPPPAQVVYIAEPMSSFGSVWLSVIAGIIFLAMGQTFGKFLAAKVSGRTFATGVNWLSGPNEGQPVSYFELQGGTAWSDCGIFLMGVALLLDAVILGALASRGRPNPALIVVAVALTSLAMLINAAVIVYLFSIGIFPLVSLVALAVGGFIVFDHAPMMKRRS